ncbi:hypothetical protein FSP39_023312 [Pinctada imbricata]|uniref:NADP-dependent oxidoreductase domain-containing protein 1 n=1 Tax=Pinctada imbricata TaxID=66713 RepID=A0AA88XXW9_PINIB|nr:hypothetical protein FSP39_023312 [Pinctada imbricata]
MASTSAKSGQDEETLPADITQNLKTLQFESALSDDEKQLLHLRERSHALTVAGCVHATFMARLLQEARQIRTQMKNPQKKAAKILSDNESRDPLKIGLLGCGRLGSQLAHCLLTYGGIHPKHLKISTRRPETLEYLQNKGVDCFHDNIKLVSNTHLVILAVLPSQLQVIAEEIKDHIPQASIVYSLVASFSPKRLKQLLLTTNIIHPVYTWAPEGQVKWDISCNVNTTLENPATVRRLCPLPECMKEGLIQTSDKLLELMIFAVLNLCTALQLTKVESLGVLHTVTFRDSDKDKLREEDFIRKTADTMGVFPRFDLVRIAQTNTSVHKRLSGSEHLKSALIDNFVASFDEYVQKKLASLRNQKKF